MHVLCVRVGSQLKSDFPALKTQYTVLSTVQSHSTYKHILNHYIMPKKDHSYPPPPPPPHHPPHPITPLNGKKMEIVTIRPKPFMYCIKAYVHVGGSSARQTMGFLLFRPATVQIRIVTPCLKAAQFLAVLINVFTWTSMKHNFALFQVLFEEWRWLERQSSQFQLKEVT